MTNEGEIYHGDQANLSELISISSGTAVCNWDTRCTGNMCHRHDLTFPLTSHELDAVQYYTTPQRL